MAERPAWLTRNLVALSAVSFAQDAASELLYPILPIFLTVTLGAPVAVVGIVDGLAEAASALTRMASGRAADRMRRRPIVAAGYSLAALGKGVVAAATVWPVVLAGRVIDRFGKGIRGAPRDALMLEDVPPQHRGKAFGVHRFADTLGAVVGPLLGLALFAAFDERIRPLLWIAVVPAVLSVGLIVFVREDRPVAAAPPPETEGAERLPAELRRVIGVLVAFALVNFPDSLVLLRARGLGLGVTGVIGAYLVFNVVYALAGFPLGAWSDRARPATVVALGLACFAVAYGGLALVTTSAWVWPLMAVYGVFAAANDGVAKAWVSRLTPPGRHGRAQGTFQGLSSGAILVAGLWAGLLWGGDGRLPLGFSAGVALVIAAVLLLRRWPVARVASP